jgi:hypothetical protein
MKLKFSSLLTLSALSAAVLLMTASCKKSNSSNNANGSVTATINGTAWANSFTTVGVYNTLGGEFEIAGGQYKNGDSTAFAVAFGLPITLNTPVSSDTAQVDIGYINATNFAEYDGGATAGHSILTVTAWDSTHKTITGTFSGVLYNITGGSDSLVVINGKFSSSYTPE